MHRLHLAQPLEAGDVGLAVEHRADQLVLLRVVLGIFRAATLAQAEQRRLGEEQVAVLDQLRHLAIEERHQQRGDVGAVDVGVGHDDDPLVTQAVVVVVRAGTATQCQNEILDFLVLAHLVGGGAGHVEDLAAQRQDGLGLPVPCGLGRAAGRVALDQEDFGTDGRGTRAVGQLARQTKLAGGGLALLLAILAAAQALVGLGDHVFQQDVAGFLVADQPVLEIVADDRLYDLGRLDADQLFLGLALELRLFDEDRDEG